MKTMCAWCGRVQDNDGRWVVIDYKSDGDKVISHGICPTCRVRVEREPSLTGKLLTEDFAARMPR